jgi:conjugal transfer pilin signal peptidase TrbI
MVRTLIVAFTICVAILGARGLADAAGRYRFGVNETESLPNWAYILDLHDREPKRGSLLAFVAPDNPYYPKGSQFLKRVWGLPGDKVERAGRNYYVNGRFVGYAKEVSQTGRRAVLGPTGIIPAGRYYVGTPHKDGFDSRYGEIGWIGRDRIIGIGEPIL